MIVDIFAFFISTFLFLILYFNNTNAKNKMLEDNLDNKYIIKYDVKSKNIYFALFVIALVLLWVNIIAEALSRYSGEYLLRNIVVFFIVYFALTAGYSLIKFLAASSYLKAIYKDGYVVPADAKSYDYCVKNLVKIAEVKEETASKDKTTIVFAAIYFIVFIVAQLHTIIFRVSNPKYGEDLFGALIPALLLDTFWLILAINTYFKANNNKYKNPSDSVRGKKNRMSYSAMTGVLIICGALTVFAKNTEEKMVEYIFMTNSDKNLATADSIRYVLQTKYDSGELPADVINDMTDGIDILTHSMPSDVKGEILEKTGNSSLEELSKGIKLQYDVPKIIAVISDDKIDVKIENVYVRDPK